MPKLKWLILDANVVIYLHELGIWSKVVERCEIHLSRIVAEQEVRHYQGSEHDEIIDLTEDIAQGRIHVFDVSVSEFQAFFDQFDPLYLGDLDPGESESLAYLLKSREQFVISSGDAIVYRVLGCLGRSDHGLSLEESLQKIGLGRANISWPYSKKFRQQYTKEGEQDSIRDRGVRRKKR